MDQIFESSSAGSGELKISSRNTSAQNLGALAMPAAGGGAAAGGGRQSGAATTVLAEVVNPLQEAPKKTKKVVVKKVKSTAPAADVSNAAGPSPVVTSLPDAAQTLEMSQAVNTTAQLDESVDEFADFLDSTALAEDPAAAGKVHLSEAEMDML